MSEVLFGQSYYIHFDPKPKTAMQPYAPLGTLYAAAWLRERGYDVAVFDAMLADSEDEWVLALDRERPRFAVLFEDNFNYLSKMCLLRMREAAFTMIQAARERGCTVLACGSDASDHAEAYLEAGADFVLVGEGEETLGELADHLTGRTNGSVDSIRGVVHRGEDGTLRRSPPRPNLRDLDRLPRPAWDLVDVERYRRIWLARHGHFSMNAVTTRGCPFHCNWCAKPIWGQRYAARSPASVAEEVRWLKDRYEPDHIWFADDIMGLKPGWFAAFAEELRTRDARIPFKCLSRADLLLREGEVEALARAGCEIVWMGAESGSQKVLDAMEKGIRVEQIREAARRLREAGVQVGFFLQFGYPGEGMEDIRLTFELVRECLPDDIGVSVSYPLPGTPFHDRVRDRLGDRHNWTSSDDLAMLYRGPFSTGFYRRLHAVLHHEFRMRRGWEDLKRWLRRPSLPGTRELRRVGSTARGALHLPLARRRLARLAARERNGNGAGGLRSLPVLLDPRAAAVPTAQPEEAKRGAGHAPGAPDGSTGADP
jgi:anaerobic magnesium-protoporphyrin IX monomethyl ester cyclase